MGLDEFRVEPRRGPQQRLGRPPAVPPQLDLSRPEPRRGPSGIGVGDPDQVGQGLVGPLLRHRQLGPQVPVLGRRAPQASEAGQRGLDPVVSPGLEVGVGLPPELVGVGGSGSREEHPGHQRDSDQHQDQPDRTASTGQKTHRTRSDPRGIRRPSLRSLERATSRPAR